MRARASSTLAVLALAAALAGSALPARAQVRLDNWLFYPDKQWELSAGGAVPIVDDDQSYRWLVQTRLRYFFP